MNFKKKLLTLVICSFIVIFTASCSCSGGAEPAENNATELTQVETDEKGEIAVDVQSDNQQEDKTESDGEVAEKEVTDSKTENSSNKSTDSENNDIKSDKDVKPSENVNPSEKTDETHSTKDDSDDGNTTDGGEEPLYNAEVVFDEDDFEF